MHRSRDGWWLRGRAKPAPTVDAQWNWVGHPVYLDVDGVSMVDPENFDLDDHQFHFGPGKSSEPAGETEQIFGFYAEGFDSGDYFKFTMDLDRSLSGGDAAVCGPGRGNPHTHFQRRIRQRTRGHDDLRRPVG
ncbi:MAG: hypothetical protein ACLFS5_12565 [Spirochaetaceae bacterium]